jgi:5-methylcytosine-specific restriction endonuclease McrA
LAYAASHREEAMAGYHKRMATKPDEIRAGRRKSERKRRTERPKEYRAKQQAYRATHREQYQLTEARRRAAKANAEINDLTTTQWREIKAAFRYRCVYCGKKPRVLTLDHITPLSKKGNHTVANVIPACRSCNSSKNAGPPLKPVQPMLLTLAPAKPKIAILL